MLCAIYKTLAILLSKILLKFINKADTCDIITTSTVFLIIYPITMALKKHCLALDLKDDPELIAEYEYWHQKENNWPEINESIKAAGITNMEIYRTGNRLFMIMETDDTFDGEKKAAADADNTKVQEWETLMWKFQQPLPWANDGEKWVAMKKIFQL